MPARSTAVRVPTGHPVPKRTSASGAKFRAAPRPKVKVAAAPPATPARTLASKLPTGPRVAHKPVPTPSAPPPPPAPPPVAHRPSRPPSLRPASTQPPPITGPIKLKVGDKAVHPAHGVGEVTAIEKREIGGTVGDFYVLRILDNGVMGIKKVMVPVQSTSQLRAIMSAKEADRVLDTMRAREVAVDLQPWSRRFRAYTEMIKSGEPHEIAKVLRDMYRLKFDKDLSFGERRLLDQAKSILMKELALAKKMKEDEILSEVSGIFTA
jgi:CarD family transcriptional regulator, regulator of rRNA transcription